MHDRILRATGKTLSHTAKINPMLTTYEAILRDNVLEWRDAVPGLKTPGRPLKVRVTILDEPARRAGASQGKKMAAALEKLAQNNALHGVDAAQWERDVRTDRPLAGRDN